jgi:hypothetical protein
MTTAGRSKARQRIKCTHVTTHGRCHGNCGMVTSSSEAAAQQRLDVGEALGAQRARGEVVQLPLLGALGHGGERDAQCIDLQRAGISGQARAGTTDKTTWSHFVATRKICAVGTRRLASRCHASAADSAVSLVRSTVISTAAAPRNSCPKYGRSLSSPEQSHACSATRAFDAAPSTCSTLISAPSVGVYTESKRPLARRRSSCVFPLRGPPTMTIFCCVDASSYASPPTAPTAWPSASCCGAGGDADGGGGCAAAVAMAAVSWRD